MDFRKHVQPFLGAVLWLLHHKLHAAVARSSFRSQSAKTTAAGSTFGSCVAQKVHGDLEVNGLKALQRWSTFEVTFLKIRTWLERTVFWCGGGAFFWHLGDAILDLVFFESESNVRHRPCPWFGAFGHLLAGCSGVVGARFLASWGCHFWTLFSSNQKATLDTGHVHGSGPSGTSWQGVLVWWGHVFWHLGDAISGPCFLSKAMSRGSVWRRRAFCFHCFATQRSQEQVLPFVFLCLTWIRPLSSFGQTCAPHFGQL